MNNWTLVDQQIYSVPAAKVKQIWNKILVSCWFINEVCSDMMFPTGMPLKKKTKTAEKACDQKIAEK